MLALACVGREYPNKISHVLNALRATAAAHRAAGLRAVTGEHYEGGHWLGTFAVYLVTGRRLPDGPR